MSRRIAVIRRLAQQAGQGTVEYVGLILLVAGVLAAVVVWGNSFKGQKIGEKITTELEQAIDRPASKAKP